MIENSSWLPSFASLFGLGLMAAGLLLWFIVRRQKQKLWLPVLRVIDLEFNVLPKLRWLIPPLWPLFCFALGCLGLAIYLFEPSETVVKSESLDLRPTHVFFDLSPSMSFGTTSAQYGKAAGELLSSLSGQARLSFSFSSLPKIYLAADISSAPSILAEQGFHRAGLKLGAAIDDTLRRSPDIEHLIIVSDRDQGSWEDFNWHYLEKKMQISWYPLPRPDVIFDNVFIDDLKRKEGSGSAGWTLILRRTGQGRELSGDIKVELEGKLLARQTWQFSAEAKSLELDVNIPSDALNPSSADAAVPLQWTLSPTGPEDLLIDNNFNSWLAVKGQRALLVAQPRGEMFLEDSVFHLRTSLEILGFRTQRVDKIEFDQGRWSKPDLLVSEMAPQAIQSESCPSALIQKAGAERLKNLQIWLLPSPDLSDYGGLCHCFASLAKAPEALTDPPAYCENLETRDQYVGVLQSLGASQIGGQIDSPLGALAMNFKNNSLSTQILAFTLPLNPSQKGGISFGQLPLMLKSLLDFLKIGQEPALNAGQWPRVEDITPYLSEGEESLASSNVPLIESLLRQQSLDQLPPVLSLGSRGFVRQSSIANQEEDAKPWVYLVLSLVALALWLESIGYVISRFAKNKRWAIRWFGGIGLFICLGTDPLEAQVRLNALGYPALGSLAPLRRDVGTRTSIDLHEEARQFGAFDRQILSEPWLWSANPSQIDGLQQKDWNELTAWLQRGGFLIVENHGGGERLKTRILEQLPQGSWKPIPPDHELMRSFHLLASLPQCGELVWEGFHFDQRIGVVLIPGEFLSALVGGQPMQACFSKFPREQALRAFINLLMVALATDYKKDQIHLPEILKRLR